MDLKFSPTSSVLALGQVTGAVRVYSYNEQETKEMMTFDYHTDSVRAVEYSPDGNMIYTGSKDMSLAVITNGTMAGRILEAHPAPIYSVLHMENGNVLATGDDDGMIRIWDLRQASKGKKHVIVMEFAEHEGTVTSMVYSKES